MRFATIAAFVASVAVAQAASVQFWTVDTESRTVYFTPNAGDAEIAPVTVSHKQNTTVTFPDTWVGNFYAVPEGQPQVPGMLGEINFGAWGGLTFFDVSAIVNPADHGNVKQIFPAEAREPMSGCEVFPCGNAYWLPDDVQTKTTHETDLVCVLGSGSTGYSFAEAH